MTKISQTGYSIQEALSELIDNAIDARIDGEKLIVDIHVSPEKIVISDNASGMDESQAASSIRLGYSEKQRQLGEFGLGLKTATSFLGEKFELRTKQRNSDEEYVLAYDERHWLESGNWNNYPFRIIKGVEMDKNGTTVTIEKLKIEITSKLLDSIVKEFGARFAPFIKNGEFELNFNNQRCIPYEPYIINNEKIEFSIDLGKEKVSGWWGYQLAGFNKSYYGFNTFRRGRLVTTYDKIGLSLNEDIRQIIGEIHIEGVPITHDKKGWLKTSAMYQELELKMREYFKQFEKKPKRILSGYPVSGGKIAGRVRLVNMFMVADAEREMARIEKGDIIVTSMTRPHFLLGIRRAAGIITDMGGTLCHAAIVAREFDIPAVVGTQIATSTLTDGQMIILDGDGGYIYEN
ncbi:MAG TPA: PEP-utilizing enzyme [Patescibacteria group bacterium]